jgi:hypothetical protein
MSSSPMVLAIQPRCESREYKKPRANDRGKEDLHLVVVPVRYMTERNPNHHGRQNGQSLQPFGVPAAGLAG